MANRFGTELRGKPVQHLVHAAATQLVVELIKRVAEDVRADLFLEVVDQGMADLVEQAKGHDLAGVGARSAARRPFVQPVSQPASRGDLVDEELTVGPEVGSVEVVFLP